MATTLTRNLKLRLDSNLTANSKYNLEKIDALGATFLVDTTEQLLLRSKGDVVIEPESADIGGSGIGGTVQIGTPSHILDSIQLYTQALVLSTNLGLADQTLGGTRDLLLQYTSGTQGGGPDTTADRTLSVDLVGADRSLILGGDVTVLGGSLTLNLPGTTSVILPSTGILSTLSGAETLTNKVINAASNTLIGITNSNISNIAGIDYSKLNLAGSIVNADVSISAGITYSKLNLSSSITNTDVSGTAAIAYTKLALSNSITNSDIASNAGISYSKLSLNGSVTNADISASASIARSKIAPGFANEVLINDGSGNLSSASALPTSLGGTGNSGNAIYPISGNVLTDSNTATLTNKSISGLSNSLTNIGYSSLNLTNGIVNADVNTSAGIVYSKLNLSNSIRNSDVLSNAAIAGTKISPNFGNQQIRTLDNIAFEDGGFTTTLTIASSGQSSDLDFRLPPDAGIDGQVIITNGSGDLSFATITGTGTVTSVSLTAPVTELSVSGSPITTAGTLALSWIDQSANKVFSGPTTGADATPAFRSLVLADLPAGLVLTTRQINTTAPLVGGGDLSANRTLSITQSTTSTDGYLSSTDWNTFNGKQNALTFGDLTDAGTDGITVGNGTGAVIGTGTTISQHVADSTHNGYLSSTDWATFNGKQPAGNYITALTGDVTASGPGSASTTLATVNANTGSFGDASHVAVVTLNGKGLTTAASSTAIQIAESQVTNLTTDLAGKQPLSADLTALAGLATTGLLVRTGSGTAVTRTLVAGTNISLTNADGVAGNITINALPTVLPSKTNWITSDGTTKTVTHSLGSTDVLVQVFDKTDGQTIYVDTVIRTDSNTVTLTASVAPGAAGWRVLILAI